MKVTYSQAAQRDRLRHVEYVQQFSYTAADRLDERIEEHVTLLRSFPQMGKQRGAAFRELAVQRTNLLIHYQVEQERVLILRILHSAQEWPGRF